MDEEPIPELVAPLAGGGQAGHLLPGEVGDDTQGLGYQGPGNKRAIGHGKLDKSLFGPTLLPAESGCQAQNAGKRAGSAAEIGQKGFFCLINDMESISK